MSRVRVFVAGTAAAVGLMLMAQPAGAIIINGEIGEGAPPSPPPPPGALVHLCLTIRPNPAICINI